MTLPTRSMPRPVLIPLRLLDAPPGYGATPQYRGAREEAPDELTVALHRDAVGVCESIDHFRGFQPQASIWRVETYRKVGERFDYRSARVVAEYRWEGPA